MKQFYEELLEDAESKVEQADLPKKPLNKITKFANSDSSGSDNDDDDDKDEAKDSHNTAEDKNKNAVASGDDGNDELRHETKNGGPLENQTHTEVEKSENQGIKEAEALGPPAKRQCTDADVAKIGSLSKKVEGKSVDKLIEAELAELGDRSKVSPRVSLYFYLLVSHLSWSKYHVRYLYKSLPGKSFDISHHQLSTYYSSLLSSTFYAFFSMLESLLLHIPEICILFVLWSKEVNEFLVIFFSCIFCFFQCDLITEISSNVSNLNSGFVFSLVPILLCILLLFG